MILCFAASKFSSMTGGTDPSVADSLHELKVLNIPVPITPIPATPTPATFKKSLRLFFIAAVLELFND